MAISRAATAGAATAPLLTGASAKVFCEKERLLNVGQIATEAWDRLFTEEDRRKLGGDMTTCFQRHGGTVGMWLQVHKVWPPRAVITIARGIGLLSDPEFRWLDGLLAPQDPTLSPNRKRSRRPASREDDPEGRVEKAVRGHTLVLVQGESTRRVYWRQQRWHGTAWGRKRTTWDLLWALADGARRSRGVAWDQLTSRSRNAITDTRSRLKKYLPPDLDALVIPAGPGAYRLDLTPKLVRLIQLESGEGFFEADDD